MDANHYNGPPPDDDPHGEHQDEPCCPDCGVGPDLPCRPDCGCVFCRRRELLQAETDPEAA